MLCIERVLRDCLLLPTQESLPVSSELIDVIATRVQMLVTSAFMASLHLPTNLLKLSVITVTLVWFDPRVVTPAVLGFATLCLLIYNEWVKTWVEIKKRPERRLFTNLLAERTGLEPATPGVTGRYSNQLNYRSKYVPRRHTKHGVKALVGAAGFEPATFAL